MAYVFFFSCERDILCFKDEKKGTMHESEIPGFHVISSVSSVLLSRSRSIAHMTPACVMTCHITADFSPFLISMIAVPPKRQ